MPFANISTVKSFLIYLFHWYLSYIITEPAVHHPTKLQYPHFELFFGDFAPNKKQKKKKKGGVTEGFVATSSHAFIVRRLG